MAGVVVLGSGFVGAAVTRALGTRHETAVLDLPTHPELARRGPAAVATIRGEIERLGASVVVNTSGRLRGTDEEMVAANVSWPEWLVTEVLAPGGVRLVHLGSAAEYGDPGSATPVAEDAPTRPRGIYGETKWAGTAAVLAAREDGLDAVVARGFNLVATALPPSSPLHQFRADVEALPPGGGTVELWWPATVRDFILLDDLADAVAALAGAPTVPAVVNICSGVGVRFDAIVEAMGAATGRRVDVRSLDRPGIEAVVGDNTLMRRLTGLSPAMSAELVARTVLGHPR